MYTKSQTWVNFGLTCVPEKGRGFVMVRAVTANLVSKDARDFKEKSHETARRDLLALWTYRAKRLGGADSPSLFRVKTTYLLTCLASIFMPSCSSLMVTEWRCTVLTKNWMSMVRLTLVAGPRGWNSRPMNQWVDSSSDLSSTNGHMGKFASHIIPHLRRGNASPTNASSKE